MDFVIVIPVLNQLDYTRSCLAGLQQDGVQDSRIVVVDNASTDATPQFLAARSELRVIRNEANCGCGGAWNQGVRSVSATWTVVLNNDVLIPQGWLSGLIDFAEAEQFDVVSPAMCEGEMDYDFQEHSREFMKKMARARRSRAAYGPCFMVHRRVFDTAGLFDDDPRLGGYEDDEFFRRARQHGFRLAVTGRSFLHHFSSVTQKAIKASMGRPKASLGDRAYYRKKYGLTWFKRHRSRLYKDLITCFWRINERARYGCTLLSSRENSRFVWR